MMKAVPGRSLKYDQNHKAFEKMEESGDLAAYKGQHIAFVDGTLVGNEPDEETLIRQVIQRYPKKGAFIHYVLKDGEEEEPPVRIPHPRRIIREQV